MGGLLEGRCRICSLKQATIDVFSDVAKKKDLGENIRKYLNIEVTQDDVLPKSVCKKCMDAISKFHRFASNAIKMQDKMQGLALDSVQTGEAESHQLEDNKAAVFENPGEEELEVSVDPFSLMQEEGVTTRERRKRAAVTALDMQELSSDLETDYEDHKDEDLELDDLVTTSDEDEADDDGTPPPRRTRARSEREEQEKDLTEFYQLLCSECGQKSTNFTSLATHCKTVHDCRPTVKCHCGKAFNRRSHLIRHRHQHLGVHRFKCETCGRGFHFKFMLRSHMFTHGPESEKPYKCDQCPRGYITKSGLTNHRLMKHLPPRARVTCDICQHTFSHPNCLYTHKKTVHGEQRHFVCHICGKTMSTLGNLKGHLETHRESCNVQCEVCGKRFKTRMRLVRHMEYHRSTWHECSVCGKTYQTRGALRSHLLVHSDQRPHKCSLCHKAFKRSKQLKLHLYQHTGERPYKCPHCPKTFTNAGNRATHKRRIHSKQVTSSNPQQQPVTMPVAHIVAPPQQEHIHAAAMLSNMQQQSMMNMMGNIVHPLPPPPHNIPHIIPPPPHMVPHPPMPSHHAASYANLCQQTIS